MDKRKFGLTDIMISPLGLGTVKFGRNEQVKYPRGFQIPEERELASLLALAQDLGINLLDTAPAYGMSEERLGRLLKGRRQDWVIAGKAGEDFEDGCSLFNFTPAHFEESLARSLKKLQTDYLDIFLIHSDGNDEKILKQDALIEALQTMKARGLVRAVGASTKTAAGGLLALERLDVVMASYGPGNTAEEAVLGRAAKTGQGVLLKKVLNSGHLGNATVQEAMDFAFAHPGTTAVVAGTINPDHLRENAAAVRRALRQARAGAA